MASHTDSLSPVITLGFSQKDVETLCIFYFLLRHSISRREVEGEAAFAHQREMKKTIFLNLLGAEPLYREVLKVCLLKNRTVALYNTFFFVPLKCSPEWR